MTADKSSSKVGFGGGCHWCTEAVFSHLRGVSDVQQGFIKSDPPHESWSEAVIVSFDPNIIDLRTLTDIHLRTHSSQSDHTMRGKYRSAIYTYDRAQSDTAKAILGKLRSEFDKPIVTQVLPFQGFKTSDHRFQNYYAKDPERPFCKTYIDPKLKLLRAEYASHSL